MRVNDCFPVFDIRRRDIRDCADSHAASRRKFNSQPVAWIRGSGIDFINHVLVENLDLIRFPSPGQFLQSWTVERVLEVGIKAFFTKLIKAERREKRNFLVLCLLSSDCFDMKSRTL